VPTQAILMALVTKLAPQPSQLQRCETLPSVRSAEASGATIGSEQDSHIGKSRAPGQKVTCDRTFSANCNMKPPYPPGTWIASRRRIFSTSIYFWTARPLIGLSTALILDRHPLRRPFLPPLRRGLTLLAFTGFGGVLGPSSCERLIAMTVSIVADRAVTGSSVVVYCSDYRAAASSWSVSDCSGLGRGWLTIADLRVPYPCCVLAVLLQPVAECRTNHEQNASR
jgi:hypothetical protein